MPSSWSAAQVGPYDKVSIFPHVHAKSELLVIASARVAVLVAQQGHHIAANLKLLQAHHRSSGCAVVHRVAAGAMSFSEASLTSRANCGECGVSIAWRGSTSFPPDLPFCTRCHGMSHGETSSPTTVLSVTLRTSTAPPPQANQTVKSTQPLRQSGVKNKPVRQVVKKRPSMMKRPSANHEDSQENGGSIMKRPSANHEDIQETSVPIATRPSASGGSAEETSVLPIMKRPSASHGSSDDQLP